MKKLIIVVMACYGLNAGAQVRQSKNFLQLYSDSVVYADRIRLRPDFLNYLQIRADSKRFPLEQVKFFNNEDGFFANTRKLSFIRTSAFAERIIEGRINIFQEVSFEPFLYDRSYSFRDRRDNAVNVSMYYNKGDNDLKNVNYRNLKEDMTGNAESLRLLASYRKSMTIGRTLYISAGATIIASVLAFALSSRDNHQTSTSFNALDRFNENTNIKRPNLVPSLAMLGAGIGFMVGGYAVSVSGTRNLERAIDTYNK